MSVSVAVVGAGYWGPNLIRNFSQAPGCELAAVCDLNSARLAPLAEKYPFATLTSDLDAVLADPSIDAVAVATPAATHFGIARAALLAGKHVLVEKPFVLDVAQGEELLRLAGQQGRVMMVDHIFLYNPAVARLAGLVAAGELGEVRYVRTARTSLGPRVCEDTNVVWDAQIHDLYILLHVLGMTPTSVTATGRACLRPGIEDVVFTTLTFPTGALANCHNTSYAPVKERRMVLVGSERMAIYDEMAEQRVMVFDRGFAPHDGVDAAGNHGLRLFDDGCYPAEFAWREPLLAECEHFRDCILEGKQPISDGRSALDLLRVLLAIDTSLKEGREVVL